MASVSATTPTTSTTNTTTAQQNLNSLLQKLGITSAASTTTTSPNTSGVLGQSDFLQLMTTQLQDQDPTAPEDDTQMVAQMAQFSTVTGITQLNTTLSGIATNISENRIATAATFVGRTVLVPGSSALPDSTGAVSGAIDLPSSASDVTVNISDTSGNLVKSIDLGANAAGLVGFSWDGNDASGNPVGDSSYNVTATMTASGQQSAATTDVYAPVTEVQVVSDPTQPQTLTVQGVGTVNMTDVLAIKY
jgi:flagellar basal-body rod modification protein FlgD